MAKAKRKYYKVGASKLAPGSTVVKLIAVGAGYLLGDTINGAIDKVIPQPAQPAAGVELTTGQKLMKYLPLAAQGGLGGLLLLKKGKPSFIKTGVGGLLLGSAVKRAVKQFGSVGGYQATPVIAGYRRKMAGYQQVPTIGAIPPQLAGIPGQLQGFRVNGYQPTGSGANKIMGSVNPVNAMKSVNGFGVGDSIGYMG